MMDELYNALKAEQKKSGLVCTIHPNVLMDRVNNIRKQNGLPLIGVHGLRHSFASLAYHLRIPERIAMEIGGWANISTMQKVYTHIAKSDITRYQTELQKFYLGSESANENANTTM